MTHVIMFSSLSLDLTAQLSKFSKNFKQCQGELTEYPL